MKRNLRLFMMSLLCAVAGVAWGQSPKVTLDFTTNEWNLPEGSAKKATDAAQFTNGTYTISLQAADGYYFNTDGYLMLGKKGSTLTLPAFNFKVGTIAVTGTGGASAAVKQNIFVGDNAVSDETTGAKDVPNNYEIASDYQTAGTVYTLKVTSAHNTQITKIEIYESGTAVKPTPEMSFEPTSVTVTLGESVTPPTLSYEGDGTVTYSISDTNVATIDASSGKLTPKSPGTATVTATAEETNSYKSAKAQYKLTVKSPAVDDGDDYSITFSDLSLDNGVQYLDPFDGGAFTVTFSGGTNDGKYYTIGEAVRVYADGKFSVSAKSGNLTKIIITYDGNYKPATNSDITVAPGTYDAENDTWEGKSPIVTFTRPTGSGHWRIKSIKVVIDENSPVEKVTPTMAFAPTSLEATLGQTVTEPTLSYNGDGAVTYSISDTKVATIDANSGKLTLVAAGSATVTATAAETNNYKKGTATYTLTVKETGQAEENTIVFADLGLENGVQYTEPFDAGNFTVTFTGGSNDGKYYNTGEGVRVYGDGSFTVESKAGNMIQITITYDGTYKPESADVASTGTYNPETGVWEGKATSVTFTRPTGSGNWRIKTISVIFEGGEVQKVLTISGTTPFTGSTTVTITPSNEDFIVYYTTDGSNPQPGSGTTKTYSKPFSITETTTVKAVEEDYSEELSAVVEKTFVKNEIATASNIAAFKALELNTEATLTLTNAQVLWVNNNDVYVRDASGAIEFYNLGIEFETNNILNGTITGKYSPYRNLPEIAKTEDTNADNLTITAGSEATPKSVSVADLCTETYLNDLVEVTGTISIVDEKTILLTSGDDNVTVYNKFKIDTADLTDGATMTIKGIGCVFGDTWQILPLTLTKASSSRLKGDANGDKKVDVTDAMCIVDYLLGKTPAKFIYNNANWDNNETVDITDAMSIVDYILGN